jgi:ABC-type multidrug transport system fused ATPase/permease subunit
MTSAEIRAERIKRIIAKVTEDVEVYDRDVDSDLKRLWHGYLHPFRIRIFVAFLITFVWCVHPYLLAILSKFLVDEVLMVGAGGVAFEQFTTQLPLFRRYVSILFGLWGIFIVCHWIRSWIIIGVGQDITLTFRKQLYEKLNALHVGFFEKNETGKIVSRVLDDVKVIREWATTHILNLSANVIRLILGLVIIFFLNWRLSLFVLVSLPIYAWLFIKIRPIIKETSIALRRINSSMYAISAERISGIKVVKAFTQEPRERSTFALRMNNWIRLAMRIIRYQEGLGLIAGLITAIVSGLIIYVGVTQIQSGDMTLGDVVVFINILPNLFLQVRSLSVIATSIQAVLVVIGRVFYLLDQPEEVVPGRTTLEEIAGEVVFENVTFRYPGQDSEALHNANFRIQPGWKVALMGPSGAGKSTVFQLLCRFYDPDGGSVKIDGIDLRDADPTSIRRHARMVQQEPAIFSGTVAENIVYGTPDATPALIMNATRQAELHEFIMTLPVKYETEVGRNGVSLSGGQKQRLALSTALLTDPEILLLDDTTSALDAETETRIRATLNRVLKGRTSFIITQRIATARDCDLIIVLEEGRITQMGTHDRLKQAEGFYRRIYEQQESL